MYLSAVILGLGFSCLGLGIYISMRIFNIPDITTDGSFTLGGAVTAVCLTSGWSAVTTLPFVFFCGAFAGIITGYIHTRFRINALLAGILVMTGLYSINLAIMGRSNIPLINIPTLYNVVHFDRRTAELTILLIFIAAIVVLLSRLLRTDFGLAMRATGNNDQMIRALGVNTNRIKIYGLALANGLTALSGYLIVQLQGYADISMGIGIVILGLGAVMIGEIVLKPLKKSSVSLRLIAVVAGSIFFRLLLSVALDLGIDPLYLKLVVAILVFVVVAIPEFRRTAE
jgi:putative tryptophan/tyrosine transport system permease protein